MSAEDNLKSVIAGSRKVSEDGTIVTYDLTKDVDFSNPRKVAEALSEVFFETDAVNWFKVSGDHVDFKPDNKVRIILAEEHNKKLENTIDDFLADLMKKEIHPKFLQQVNDNATRASRMKTAMAVASFGEFFFRHYDRKDYKDFIQDDLFTDILENLEIRSLNDDDLMDWKHLPL